MTCATLHGHGLDLSATQADEVPRRLHKSNLGFEAFVTVHTVHVATGDDSLRFESLVFIVRLKSPD